MPTKKIEPWQEEYLTNNSEDMTLAKLVDATGLTLSYISRYCERHNLSIKWKRRGVSKEPEIKKILRPQAKYSNTSVYGIADEIR